MVVRNMLAVGFLSAMAVIGIVNASDSVASDANRTDLIEKRVGHGGSIYYKGGQVSGCHVAESDQNKGELVEERIGHGGSIYYRGGQVSGCHVVAGEQNGGELIEERVGHGGSIYSRRPVATRISDCAVNCGGAVYSDSPRIAN